MEAVQAVVARIPSWVDLPSGLGGNTFAEDVALILRAAAEAGWVVVPGPVHTEWAYQYPDGGTSYPTTEEVVRRLVGDDMAATAVARQAIAWRAAPESKVET